MRNPRLHAAAAALLAALGPGPVFAESAQPSAAPKTNEVARADAMVPESVFAVPANPKQGRNPFFPDSTFAKPAQPAKSGQLDVSAFVLNGITSPPRRSAMINGRTFEPGEEAEIKLPTGGKVLIKCAEIKDDSVVIQVAGQQRELRFRAGI